MAERRLNKPEVAASITASPAASFKPDWAPGITWGEYVGEADDPYLRRWVFNFGRFGAIRVHHWLCSDDLRNLHDHPFSFVTLILKGGYTDLTPGAPSMVVTEHDGHGYVNGLGRCVCEDCVNERDLRSRGEDHLRFGSIRFRRAEHRHAVKVDEGGCWSLLLTGRHRRKWGFWHRGKFIGVRAYFRKFGHHPCDR